MWTRNNLWPLLQVLRDQLQAVSVAGGLSKLGPPGTDRVLLAVPRELEGHLPFFLRTSVSK